MKMHRNPSTAATEEALSPPSCATTLMQDYKQKNWTEHSPCMHNVTSQRSSLGRHLVYWSLSSYGWTHFSSNRYYKHSTLDLVRVIECVSMFCRNLQNSCLAVARHVTSKSPSAVYCAIATSNNDLSDAICKKTWQLVELPEICNPSMGCVAFLAISLLRYVHYTSAINLEQTI